MARSIAKACLRFTGLYEAELLTELMLRHWNHPLAGDADFRAALLESTAEVLRASVAGEVLMEELPPEKVSFVAATWYAESVAVMELGDIPADELSQRKQWLDALQRAVPSCFCDPDLLEGP